MERFTMECPGCGKQLGAENRDGILKQYDVHVHKEHAASPAQWTEAHNKIVEGKEKAKAKSQKQGG